MEGFNDVWANILNDNLLNPRDLTNIQVLEPPSSIHRVNLNLESHVYESSMDSMLPLKQSEHKKVRDDAI